MRRAAILILCAALLIGVVSADNTTNSIHNTTTVLPDGSAQVTLTVSVTLDEPVMGLTFPVPRDAENVTLNGAPVETTPSRINDSVDLVSLSRLDGVIGDHKLSFGYTIPAVIDYKEDKTIPTDGIC